MKHSREDYNRIQDPAGLIPENEPVFLIRGQDVAGPHAVRAWAAYAKLCGAKQDIVDAANVQARKMENWHKEHLRKVPDIPLGAADYLYRRDQP